MISEDRLYAGAESHVEGLQQLDRAEALRKLQTVSPSLLAYLTAVLFERQGYATRVTALAAGEDVDVVATRDRWTIVVQCRQSVHSAGQPIVRDLYSAMLRLRADEAYLVTTGQITPQAQQWAADKPIHLIDGLALVDWARGSKPVSRSIFAGVRLPYVVVGALAALALFALVAAGVVAYPQIASRLGIDILPTTAWEPPPVSSTLVVTATPASAVGPSEEKDDAETPALAATESPPTPTPSPAPTATPEPTVAVEVCSVETDPALVDLYSASHLGCATAAMSIVWAAWQPFEGGFLLWRSDTDAAYAFYGHGGGTWFRISDTWDGSTDTSRGDPPPGRQAPIRGFGYVWALSDELFHNLGWATDQEKGFCALVQPFDDGFLLRSSTVEYCTPDRLFNHARTQGWSVMALAAHSGGWSSGA
jgi:hypothetical protein